MSAATIVASLVLIALLAAAPTSKLLDPVSARKNAEHLGVSTGVYLFVVSACEGLTLVGLIFGLFCWTWEIVAASGVALLVIAALVGHRHSGEPTRAALPIPLGLFTAAAVIGGQLLLHAR
jgi:hypothetical protein